MPDFKFAVKKLVEQDEGYVLGAVYAPLQVDTDGETMTAHDVKKMAHEFIALGMHDHIDVQHDMVKSGVVVVESFLARKGDPDFPVEGTWVLGVKIDVESEIWQKVKKGEINGFSFAAHVIKTPRVALIDAVQVASGETEKSTDEEVVPAHSHTFYVEMNEEGRITMGFTDAVQGHVHKILRASATEEEAGHSHRFFI